MTWDTLCFKPYYKWNTFNTKGENEMKKLRNGVLNLVINGIPSTRGRKILFLLHDKVF